ncbi:hypothetical protein BUALT_Bualt05G0030500 [Buddleja alternifolia]|uniref:aspartate--tRNA ligase n=1 Tax=Buddleja alternifolia TaxID=168488 RepID=A0AAV6XG85_9LAMI|nr:hypothetical protein BUALT_Bualt05G0030500 [Buddleja alternifolia]
MSSEELPQNPNSSEENAAEKKLSKKELAKLERHQEAAGVVSAVSTVNINDDNPLAANYGEIPFNDLQLKRISGRKWTEVNDLTIKLKDKSMLIRGYVVSPQMVKFATSLSPESVVDIKGVVSVPAQSITGATQQAGQQLAHVNQNTRLNFRYLDPCTPANQGMFSIKCHIKNKVSQFLLSEGFREIKTPEIIAGSSEGGLAVFKLDYKGKPACLAQSPQLHKQMAVSGLDVEMDIKEHYSEVMDLVDRLFVAIFDYLNEKCSKELEDIRRQHPFENLKYLPKTLRLTFEEGVQMLKEAGVEIDPLGDLNTESERKLGQLVLEKYAFAFYFRITLSSTYFTAILWLFGHSIPCHVTYDDPNYSNSFDVFIRGEEIILEAQRIHVPWYLEERALECGIDVETLSTYIESFRYGTPPHVRWIWSRSGAARHAFLRARQH